MSYRQPPLASFLRSESYTNAKAEWLEENDGEEFDFDDSAEFDTALEAFGEAFWEGE